MQILFANINILIIIFVSSYLLFFIPGKIVNNNLLKNESNFFLSLIIGFSLFTLTSFFFYELNLKIIYSIILYLLIDIILIFFFYKTIFQKRLFTKKILDKNLILVFSCIILILLLTLINPIYLDHDGADMWSFISIVRSFKDDGFFSNVSPWFDTLQSAYPSNSFFLYLAIIDYLCPYNSIFEVFRMLGIYLILFSIFTNIQVLNFFIKNIKNSTIIVIFIYALSFFVKDNLILNMTNYPYYPKIFSPLIFVPTLIYIFFSDLYKNQKFPFFLTLILISFVNQSSINLIISGILIFTFLILENDLKNFSTKLIRICIPLIITTSFVYFYLSNFYFEETGVISTYSNDLSINASEGQYFGILKEIFDGYYIFDPNKYFSGFIYFYLLIFVISIAVYKKIRTHKLLLYHYLMLVISFLIVFNPISIFIINKLMPVYFLVRINLIFVGYIFLGYLVYVLVNHFENNKYIFNFMFLSSILLLIALSGFYYQRYNNSHLYHFKELEKYFENIPVKSFTISDKNTSNKILALRKVKILISNEEWIKAATPITNFEIYSKIYDENDLFLDQNIFKYLNSINADYLLVNKQKTKNYQMLNKDENIKIIFSNELFLLYEI